MPGEKNVKSPIILQIGETLNTILDNAEKINQYDYEALLNHFRSTEVCQTTKITKVI